MSKNLQLNTPLGVIDDLNHRMEGKTGSISISVEIMRKLLMDHTNMVRELREHSTVWPVEPKSDLKLDQKPVGVQRKRVKL